MARRRRQSAQVQDKTELQPKKSPSLFLIIWLGVPMIFMIGYALYLTRF